MSDEKTFVYDNNLVKTQRFKVSLPGVKGRIIVDRKEIIRKPHNMGCTDGIPEEELATYTESHVSYDVVKEASQEERVTAIKAVNKELGLGEDDGC